MEITKTTKIELRNISHSARNSEETDCFVADVYLDGKKAGEARNQGHGGPTDIYPVDLSRALDAYGATLPPHVCDFMDPETKQPATLTMDAELIVGDLLTQWILAKDLRRALGRSPLTFDAAERAIYKWSVPRGQTLAQTLEAMQKKGRDLLNMMPQAQALDLYRYFG